MLFILVTSVSPKTYAETKVLWLGIDLIINEGFCYRWDKHVAAEVDTLREGQTGERTYYMLHTNMST